jgi:hypothetical protein
LWIVTLPILALNLAALDNTSRETSVHVIVNPDTATLQIGQSQQFSAEVIGTPNQKVYWRLAGKGCSKSACGTIDQNGFYTAPAAIPNPPTVFVAATSAADHRSSGSATVTVIGVPLAIAVSPNPPAPIVAGSGATIAFTATLTGAPANTSVNWGLECNSTSDSNGDFCFDTDSDGDGPGCTQLPGGFQVCGARANVGPGNEVLTYTPPTNLYLTNFQPNTCTISPTGNGMVPITATVTYNGNVASQTVCITVTTQ